MNVKPFPARTALAILSLATALPAAALNINTNFADNAQGVDLSPNRECVDKAVRACELTVQLVDGVPVFAPYAACGRDQDLQDMVEAAADYWADVYDDQHYMTIHFWWAHDAAPQAGVLQWDRDGQPVEGYMCLPADIDWYYDPTPEDDAEYAMNPKLYRTLHPIEKATAVVGDLPEVFEVGYNGEPIDPDAASRPDLMSVILHEMGHILGLHPDTAGDPPFVSCTAGTPWYGLNPALIGGYNAALYGFDNAGSVDCAHLALGGVTQCRFDPTDTSQNALSLEPSTYDPFTVGYCIQHQSLMWPGAMNPASFRARPEAAAILAAARSSNWSLVDLPRKFSLDSGLWSDDSIWMGNRSPDSQDHVYIVNNTSDLSVQSFNVVAARSLSVTSGNSATFTFQPATFTEFVDVREQFLPEDATVPPDGPVIGITPETSVVSIDGAELSTGEIRVGDNGRFAVGFNGEAQATTITVANQGDIVGQGPVRVDFLDNRGSLRAGGGTLEIVTITPGGGIVLNPPVFDLDGHFPESSAVLLQATSGDLIIDGPVSDPVRAEIEVGSGYVLEFTRGWEQQFSSDPDHVITLNGTLAAATIAGVSTLNGRVDPVRLGRFADRTFLQPAAQVEIGIAGPGDGSYDQLVFDNLVEIDGTLALTLENGYLPPLGASFEIMTFPVGSGEFHTVTGAQIGPDSSFVVRYEADHVRLEVVSDSDGDGVVDEADNCTAVANPGQIDADNDGIGNLCDADLDQNCFVNFGDLSLLSDLFFSNDPVADLNSDGIVNFADLALFKEGFFAAPGPSGVDNDCGV